MHWRFEKRLLLQISNNMADIKKVITDEIRRLSKKEIKSYLAPISAKLIENKRQIAALKKIILELRKSCVNAKANITQKPTAETQGTKVKVRLNAEGIKRIREKLNITQDAFAKILGVSKPAYCTWEQGRISPKPDMKAKIAAMRGMGKSDLKKLMDEMGIKTTSPRKRKAAAPEKPGDNA